MNFPIDQSSTNAEKIALFRTLFVGREDVFARRYENEKKGTSGYSPCCRNLWGSGCVLKQRKKCSECAVRQYVPVSDEVVRWHLRGKDADMKPFVMGRRQLKAERERLATIPETESRVILATGSFLGEGFDDARLDTLFLAQPISWKGRLTQFAGRLHRRYDGKQEVRIYDYVDLNIAICSKMYDRRAKGYETIGYKVMMPIGASEGWPVSVALPTVPHWEETFSDSVRRLCRDGVDEALADLFVHATLQFELGEHIVGGSEAPAAVLKFLYERLESCAETKDRFQMGVRLPIPCGANPYLEVGLLDPQGKIVVMLDSSSSIPGVEFYRSTRREDFLLQKNGYRVLRLLVEDVCTDLDAVLDAIQECRNLK